MYVFTAHPEDSPAQQQHIVPSRGPISFLHQIRSPVYCSRDCQLREEHPEPKYQPCLPHTYLIDQHAAEHREDHVGDVRAEVYEVELAACEIEGRRFELDLQGLRLVLAQVETDEDADCQDRHYQVLSFEGCQLVCWQQLLRRHFEYST